MELTFPDRPPLSLERPRMAGILNVTPDSFSDGGQFERTEAAVAQGLALAQQGATIIDIGGESTRPGAQRVPDAEQRRRVMGVIRELRRALDARYPQVVISIDTTLAAVAGPAVEAGASILNDISAGREDPAMLELAAARRLPLVLMHMQGTPQTMQDEPRYTDVVEEVCAFLLERAAAAEAAGVAASQVVLDPGIGFGKNTAHNLALLANLKTLVAEGYPVMLGASRKGFMAKVSPSTTRDASDRLGGTCATTALGVAAGVQLFRVHDVRCNLQAAEVAHAVRHGA